MDSIPLTDPQKAELERLGSVAVSWDEVRVAPGFSPGRVRNVHFRGPVDLGSLDGTIDAGDGVPRPAGLYRCCVADCSIGDGARVANVGVLSGCDVGPGALVEDVSSLVTSGETAFGNGREIEILNNGGGREIPIFAELDAQTAYLLATRRHDTPFVERVREWIAGRVVELTPPRGRIGEGAVVLNCGEIRNVTIGSRAIVRGASRLDEGTIVGGEYPAAVGADVVAKGFVILDGSRVDGGAMIENCFVGQGVRIGKQFSAEDSAFFANCECFGGEAACLFAGPYTVTHHKSTLLIAAMLSFYNAGSGSNQSNHRYKTGPVHQGVLERGAKTGSFSCLLWPCRVGAFTVVIGKHCANVDTSAMPFSYLFESKGRSLLAPAMNLFTVGTKRDSDKWPDRDRCDGVGRLDRIHFDLFNPRTVGSMVAAIEALGDMAGGDEDDIAYSGAWLKRSKIEKAVETYETAVRMYIGDVVIRQLESAETPASLDQMKQALDVRCPEAPGPWVDAAGMLAPRAVIDEIAGDAGAGRIASLDTFRRRLDEACGAYDRYNAAWCLDLLEKRAGKKLADFTAADVVGILRQWRDAHRRGTELVMKDAEKEFAPASMIGYGLDGDEDVRRADFAAVRGTVEDNAFVAAVRASLADVEAAAARWTALIGGL